MGLMAHTKKGQISCLSFFLGRIDLDPAKKLKAHNYFTPHFALKASKTSGWGYSYSSAGCLTLPSKRVGSLKYFSGSFAKSPSLYL